MAPARLGAWRRWATFGVLVGAALLTLMWVVAALAMAGRGIDLTDEGYYLLSYRWWSDSPRNPSGVQYIYGPLFEAVGHSVSALRVGRLVTVLAAHLVFGWSFAQWLATRCVKALRTRSGRTAVILVVTASGGVTYGWLPLSPGYNDVAALASLAIAAAVLRTVTVAARGHRIPVAPALVIGPLALSMVLAKWASALLTLLFLAAVLVVALRSLRAAGWVRFLVACGAGLLLSLVVVDLAVPFSEMVPPILEANRLVAARTNSPLALLDMYTHSSLLLLGRSILLAGAAGVVLCVGALAARSRFGRAAPVLIVLAPVVGLVVLNPHGLPGGGVDALPKYGASLAAMSLLVLAAVGATMGRSPRRPAPTSRQGRGADRAMVAMLLLLPMMQAAGTGNAIYAVAVNQFASWIALMVLAVVHLPRRSGEWLLALSATSLAVLLAASTGTDGLLRNPYRADPFTAATERIPGSGPLAGLRVSPDTARWFSEVRRAAGPDLAPGRAVAAFDELSGLVLLLDGRSIGEPWYSASDHARTAAGIRAECGLKPLTRPPIVIFDRRPGTGDLRALASCGVNLDHDYSAIPIQHHGTLLTVYRPST